MATSSDQNTDPPSITSHLSSFTTKCGINPEDTQTPHVIQGVMQTWLCRKWSLSKLSELIGNEMVKFRIGPRQSTDGSVLWENLCFYEEATLRDFEEWCASTTDQPLPKQHSLGKYDRDKFWCYADYKYMRDLFQNQPQAFKAVQWDSLGLPGYSGEDSTIWIGSQGAHTVCHQDSYGFNVVVQIQGRKRWYLFPPEQVNCLYPSRIPYEESSIFSEVNITRPDLAKHPRIRNSTPYVVILRPGDILYVPRHWWHFVECLDTSVSINCWVELESDHLSRLHESVTRMLIYRLLHHSDQDGAVPDWLNPTETISSHETNLSYLETALNIVRQLRDQRTTDSKSPPGESSDQRDVRKSESHILAKRKLAQRDLPMKHACSKKRRKRDEGDSEDEKDGNLSVGTNLSNKTRFEDTCRASDAEHSEIKVLRVHPTPIQEIIDNKLLESEGDPSTGNQRYKGVMEVLTQCVTDPRVVAMVTDLLLERFKSR